MSYSARKLPAVKALLSFEAAARNVSFTEAARELNVTRVAVSRQVRQLEEVLGVGLFVRGSSSVELTRAGRRLSRVVSNSFQSIVEEIESIENISADRLITIATSTGVSTYWLMPNIGRYRRIDPTVDFRLLVSYDLINLMKSGVDIAIRYGEGNWSGVHSQLLQRQMIFPACSQSFMKEYGPFESIEDLTRVKLLDYEAAVDQSSFWPSYFRDMGCNMQETPRMSSYDSYVNFVQAVLDGQGLGLVGPPLMQQFLDSGVLVKALPMEPLPQRGYYLCRPDGVTVSDAVREFYDWLFVELGQPNALPGVP
ncbi:LysR substrate-binding domain-containing protein [Rhodobacteraceae bacterium KMM 6894]|nr:LysR substrate-binding domain-containing protein [Rhodobacteraceae bacterium KMM 6894]